MLVGLAQDSEKMKSMIAFKKRLEEQLEKLTAETIEVQATLDTVNTILLEKGFKRGDIKEVAAAKRLHLSLRKLFCQKMNLNRLKLLLPQ